MEDVRKMLNMIAGIDEHLEYIMAELEHCDDMIYGENLSAANFIYWQTRKECLQELRDNYCDMRNKNTK